MPRTRLVGLGVAAVLLLAAAAVDRALCSAIRAVE
jgi:hypothetical protein